MVVYGLARSQDALGALETEQGVRPLVMDVRDASAINEALATLTLDVLVNNAGVVSSVRPLHEQTVEEIRESVEVNLTAPLLLMRSVLPGMIARRRGHIINLTTTAARAVLGGTSVYGGAKAGLAHASRVLRYDLVGTNVRVTDLAPGRVETEIYLRAFQGDHARLKGEMYASVRALQPEDIAAAVAAIISLPEHVDVTEIEVSPTDQAVGGHVFRPPTT
jgi:NADP-dependent 3-hydroxy acid dehydrogenase YdfG